MMSGIKTLEVRFTLWQGRLRLPLYRKK